VAVLAGWTTTEVGRQPWTVYGLLRTADSTSPSLVGADVLLSLLAYMVVPQSSSRRDWCARARRWRPRRSRRSRAGGRVRRSISSSCRKARRYERAELRARVDADPGRRHLLLCLARRLRPGRGHALQLHAGHPIPQSRDERDCARMGRQRDLAGAGRRRTACGLSACLRHPYPGALFSDPGHAAGAGVSRRGLRVPLSRCRAQDLLGSWLLLRLADRNRAVWLGRTWARFRIRSHL